MKFQPGQSGNPAGRAPYKSSMKAALEAALKKDSRAQIAAALVALALDGNLPAIHMIFERLDGKVVAPVAIESSGRLAITVRYEESGPIDAADDIEALTG